MSKLLKRYVDANIVKQNGTWYYIGDKKLGRTKKATIELESLIADGKVEKLGADENAPNQEPLKVPEIDTEPKELGIAPVEKPKPSINPNIKNKQELPENIQDIYEPLAANLGDIESAKKGGRYIIYVFGIDSRLKDHPTIKGCPYVFRHCNVDTNVPSGHRILNRGWSAMSKKLIKVDPRTKVTDSTGKVSGTPWLTVARDDTPDEDMISVGKRILCYADKPMFERKKSKMAMQNITRTVSVLDSRREESKKMASMSKTDVNQSMQGFVDSNKGAQVQAKEHLEKNKKYSAQEAQEYIDKVNSAGTTDQDVEKLRDMADKGMIGHSVVSSQPITLEDL